MHACVQLVIHENPLYYVDADCLNLKKMLLILVKNLKDHFNPWISTIYGFSCYQLDKFVSDFK